MAETTAPSRPRRTGPRWAHARIRRIEDLQDAVHGAGLSAMQYSAGPPSGSLSVAEYLGATFTVARIGSRISIRGPLHQDRITIGIGLRQTPGSKQWMRDVETGAVGIFLPGEEHHGLHSAGSSYVAFAMSRERLEEVAADLDLVLDPAALRSSGLYPRRLAQGQVASLARGFVVGKEGETGPEAVAAPPCAEAIRIAVTHLSRPLRGDLLRGPATGYARIVARAQDYAMAHLEQPISLEAMARAAFTSVRSLHRAFRSELGESPGAFVRRLRLHRIRQGLMSPHTARATVTEVAYRSGITQLGRMARWYREVFGELPSETRSSRMGLASQD